MMFSSFTFLTALLATTSGVLANPVAIPGPLPTPPPSLKDAVAKRATSCTFSGSDGYSLASVSKASCATIVLSSLAVPSGVTLKLEKLNDGTTVSYMSLPCSTVCEGNLTNNVGCLPRDVDMGIPGMGGVTGLD